ncbi:MAG: oligosaccharide flippase family protein [Anaerolineaceae bacterium]|nr:oligosaccharide flippase family protein [Anaerolineaceae bacterium]
MKELLNVFSLLGVQQVASLIFGFLRTKIIAAMLGPFGVGLFSQAKALQESISQFTSLGIGDGFLKLIAEYHGKKDNENFSRTIITTISVFGIIGILLVLLSFSFADQLALLIFNDPGYSWFVVIVAIAGLLFAEYYATLQIFQCMLKWREYALVSTIGYIFNIIISVILIFFSGVYGAIISILTSQVVHLLISLFVLRRYVLELPKQAFWRYKPNLKAFRQLGRFIGPLSTITIVSFLSPLIIRSEIIRRLGMDANGIYQVVWSISLAYMGLIRNAFVSFGMPRVTVSLGDPAAMRKVQNDELRLGLLALPPLTLILLAMQDIWIPFLFSSSFLSAGSILVWQFAGDILKTSKQTMNISLLPLERFRFILLDSVVEWGGWAVLSIIFMPRMGISAVTFSYFIINIATLVGAYFYHKLTSRYQVHKQNWLLISKVLPLTIIGMSFSQLGNPFLSIFIPLTISIILLSWAPSQEEYRLLIDLIKNQYHKLRGTPDSK